MVLHVVQQRKPQYPYKGPENAPTEHVRQRLKQQNDLRYRARLAAALLGISPEEYASAPGRHKMAQAFNLAAADDLLPQTLVSCIVVAKNAILTGLDALKQLTHDATPKLASRRDDDATHYLIKQLHQHLHRTLPRHVMERDPGTIGGPRGMKSGDEPRARARWLASREFFSGQGWPPDYLAELTAFILDRLKNGVNINSPTAYAMGVAYRWARDPGCYWNVKHGWASHRDRHASHKHFMAKPSEYPRYVRGYDLVTEEAKNGPAPTYVPPKNVSAEDKPADETVPDIDFDRRFRASPWGKQWTAMLDSESPDYSKRARLLAIFAESEKSSSDPPGADTG